MAVMTGLASFLSLKRSKSLQNVNIDDMNESCFGSHEALESETTTLVIMWVRLDYLFGFVHLVQQHARCQHLKETVKFLKQLLLVEWEMLDHTNLYVDCPPC